MSEADRDALLLRYFERKSAREMAQILGVSDEAAQKCVSRAVERLGEFFAKHGVTVGASGLVAVISAQAVQAAPAGLAATISTAAVLTGTAIATAATVTATATKAIAMTTLQRTVIAAVIAAAVGTGIYEARQASTLRSQVQTFHQQQAPLTEQIQQLTSERDNATRQLAALRDDNDRLNRNTAELLRLRGEVTRLRNEGRPLTPSAGETNDSAGADGIKWRPQWKDAGLSSPEAAMETYWWALANNRVDRIRQSMVFDHGTNTEPVSEIFAKREARQDGPEWKEVSLGGVRLHRVYQGGPANKDHAMIEVETMVPAWEGGKTDPAHPELSAWTAMGAGKITPVDPANPPEWSPMANQTFNLVKVDGEWKVIGNESRLRLTADDEDSEAVAKLMMQMPPEAVEEMKQKAHLPPETLQLYEAMKAKAAK